MRFTTKTEYGLVCLLYMAKSGSQGPITIKEIVQDEHYSQTFTEKILQKLRAAEIVTSHQGNQGGYALARPASQITLKEVIDALEGQTFEVFCEPDVRDGIICTHHTACNVKPIWNKTKELLDSFFGSITLEMLMNHEINLPAGNNGANHGN